MRAEKVVGMLKSGPRLCRSLSLSGTHSGFQGGKACGSSLTACYSIPGGPFSSCGGHGSRTLESVNDGHP